MASPELPMTDIAARPDERADPSTLLERFKPVIRFNEGEYFLPMSIDDYLPHCQLWRPEGRRRRTLVADVGELDRDRLVELTPTGAAGWSLQFVAEPLGRADLVAWRLDPDRPRFRGGSRLGSVGVFGRLIDAAMRFSLLLRGRVASGTEAVAELAVRSSRQSREQTCYGRVLHQDGWFVLQYWFFYAFNDWRSRAHGVNDHEADWEQVTVFCAEAPDGDVEPKWVVFSAHDEVGDDLRRRWDDPDLTLVGDRPVVYAGLGSHSGAYLPGDYLMLVDRNALGHLYTVGRRLARILLPWTRDQDHGAIGAPYIDYARGDGECVGEGDRTLRCELIDDTTPWVNAYRGMWGHDTEDPFGGERGPAGPRYERSGQVRASWRDPVGWSGLAKIPPTDAAALASTARRAEALDVEIEQLRSTRDEQLDALRSAHVLGEPTAELEAALAATTASLDLRTDEHFLIDHPPVLSAAGPHDHLRHRRVPMQADDRNRRRLLMIWAAISTPLVLIVLAFLALPTSASITTAATISLVVIFAIEAIARRRLFSYLATLVVVVLAVSTALAIVVALVTEWRFTTAGLLVLAAALIAAFNIAELRRQ